MEKKTDQIKAKYQAYINNLEWHIKTNNPPDEGQEGKKALYHRINDYKSMISDIDIISEIIPSSQEKDDRSMNLLPTIVDKLGSSFNSIYSCTRVWEAWQIGTMTQDDFEPLEEDNEFIYELASSILEIIKSHIISFLPKPESVEVGNIELKRFPNENDVQFEMRKRKFEHVKTCDNERCKEILAEITAEYQSEGKEVQVWQRLEPGSIPIPAKYNIDQVEEILLEWVADFNSIDNEEASKWLGVKKCARKIITLITGK